MGYIGEYKKVNKMAGLPKGRGRVVAKRGDWKNFERENY